MPSPRDTVPITKGQDFEATLELYCGDDRFPVSLHRFWGNAGALTHDPPGIEPVVKPLGQAVGRCFATVILDFDKRTPCAITIATCVQFFANLCQSMVVREKQIPCQPPDLELLRIGFNPTLITSHSGTSRVIGATLSIPVAIRRQGGIAPITKLGMDTTANSLAQFERFAPGQGEGDGNQQPIIGINRIEIGIIREAHRHTQSMEFINCHERLGVIATKAFGVLDGDMRELACASIIQQPLVAIPVGSAPAHDIGVFTDNQEIRAFQQGPINIESLPILGHGWILGFL